MYFFTVFMFVDSRVAIYQGGFLNNGQDLGCEDPGNAWAVFNNTFVNTLLNFGETTDNLKAPAYYDIYLRNNAFVNTKVVVSDANADRTHEGPTCQGGCCHLHTLYHQ